MLNFILGRAGTGKSTHIQNKIKELSQQTANKIFVIVPEQFTFETERKYLKAMGAKALKNVHILGFSRIAHLIFKTYGGVCGDYADESVKLILMNMALNEVFDGLNVYHKSMKNIHFTKSMLDLVGQFKHANISFDDFEDKLSTFDEGLLKEKSKDIALIYSSYSAFLSSGYKDTLDDLNRAMVHIKEHHFFADSFIFIDEFKDFTENEVELLKIMLQQANEVTVSLCFDKTQSHNHSHFSCVRETYTSLIALARTLNVKIFAPLTLEKNHRFTSPELAHLEENIFSPTPEPFSGKCENIHGILAENEYDEVDFVLAQISDLVKNQQMRYKDIVIVTRQLEVYTDILESFFKKYEIPFYMDSLKNIANSPIVKFVELAFSCINSGLNAEHMLALLKCGLCGFSYDDIALLENYVFMWDIKSKEWEQDFTFSTLGVNLPKDEKQIEQNTKTLAKINVIRKTIFDALSEFKTQTQHKSGAEISASLLNLCSQLNLHEHINHIIENLENGSYKLSENLEICEEYKRVWEILEDILNILASTIGEKIITPKRYQELFSLVCANFDMGTIPKSLDHVLVGDIKRIRTDSPKILFILGANEKVFPFVPSSSGLYTDNEQKMLEQLGIKLIKSTQDVIKEEKFIAYKTLTLPSHQLFICARKSDIKGSALAVSHVIHKLSTLFSGDIIAETYDMDKTFFCQTKSTAFSVLANNIRENTPLISSLKELFSKDDEYKQKLDSLTRALNREQFRLYNTENTKSLFGDKVFISPTKIEQFHKCKFMYFCENGLGLKKREKIKLNSLNKGLIIHDVLYEVCKNIDDYKNFDKLAIRKQIKTAIDAYIVASMGGFENKTKRFMYLYNRIRRSIFMIIERLFLELSQSEFRPCDFEYKIGTENRNVLTIPTKSGVDINLIGTIDRVDIYQTKSGQRFIRVVDYKSGAKKFNLSNIINGINLQMFIYLMCLENDKKNYENAVGAGVLYMPASDINAKLNRNDTDEKAHNVKLSHYQMSGIVLNNEDVIKAMEKDLSGKFTPISLLAKAYDKNHELKDDVFTQQQANEALFSAQSMESLLTGEQIGKLFKSITVSIENMAEEIYSGNIEAKPLVGKDLNSCEYCSYKLICGHDENMEINEYQDLKKKEIFELLDTQWEVEK